MLHKKVNINMTCPVAADPNYPAAVEAGRCLHGNVIVFSPPATVQPLLFLAAETSPCIV